MGAAHVVILLAIAHLVASVLARGAKQRDQRCLEPPEMENCTVILRKWSYMKGSNDCESNFVCSTHPNSFRTKKECDSICPPLPGKKPKPREKDCMYWILRGENCYQYWFYPYYDRHGKLHWGMLYTGCGRWRNHLYFYDLKTRKCRASEEASSCGCRQIKKKKNSKQE